jgi:Flp pilus assembly protein TadG
MLLVGRILSGRSATARKGAAVVELALCLPVLMILTMGTIETTDLIFLKTRLKTAAYEGARTATAPGQTAAAATTAATNILQQRGINSGSVTINPANIDQTTATGTQVTVTVSAPFGSNSCMKPFVLAGAVANVTASVTMIRQ